MRGIPFPVSYTHLFCLDITLGCQRLSTEHCSARRASHCIVGQTDEFVVIDAVFPQTSDRNAHAILVVHIHGHLRTVILPQEADLPSAPKQFIQYLEEDNRPQVTLDVDFENGMGISVGRLREDTVYDYKFVGLSHNTLRGAAGGAVLCAELLTAQGYIDVYKRQTTKSSS